MWWIVGLLRSLLHPHYILNILASVAYPLSRKIVWICNCLYPGEFCELDWRDGEILMLLLFVLVIKNRKLRPVHWREYMAQVFLFSKCTNVLLFLRQDARWSFLFFILCVVIFIVFPEPTYAGPEKITYFRGQALEETLIRNPQVTWVVEFFATWSPVCVHLAPVFAELSLLYDHKYLRFGKIDIGRYPTVAGKYAVDSTVQSRQVPTIVVFQNGKEITRRPVLNHSRSMAPYRFTKDGMITDFKLNDHYMVSKTLSKGSDKTNRTEETKKDS